MLPQQVTQSPLVCPEPPPFEEVFRTHFAYIWTLLRRLGVAQRDLEDVAHEVFIQALRGLSEYDANRPLRPWLFGITLNAASNYRRLARHRLELVERLPEVGSGVADAEGQLMLAQERALLEEALLRLPLERRAILILHEIEGHAVPEVARIVDIPLNTAYSRLRLARKDFAKAVKHLQQQRKTSR